MFVGRRSVVLTVLTGLVGGFLMVASEASEAREARATPRGPDHTVTLITGDRVTVAERGNRWELVHIEPANRVPAGGFFRHVGPDGVTVIPTEAVPLVRSGQLDEAL